MGSKRCWSNATIAQVIEHWVGSKASKRVVGECFGLTSNQVRKIIDYYYIPALKGDLMSITIPSKINKLTD